MNNMNMNNWNDQLGFETIGINGIISLKLGINAKNSE